MVSYLDSGDIEGDKTEGLGVSSVKVYIYQNRFSF